MCKMAVLYVLGCILFLSKMYETHPQYERHHLLRSQPIIESSALENWAYEEPGPFEPSTPLHEDYSLGYIDMNDQPELSDNEFIEQIQDIQSMYPSRNSEAIYYEKDSHENLQMPHKKSRLVPRNKTLVQNNSSGNVGIIERMENGSLRLITPANYQPEPSYQDVVSRGGDNISERRATKGEIVFPGPNSADKPFAPPVGKLGPACALGGTICEFLDSNINYPTAHVTKELEEKADEFRELFGNDIIADSSVNVTERIGDTTDQSICPSQEYVVYPKMAQNEHSDWRFIVNTEKYQQGIRIEKCINDDDHPCMYTKDLPIGHVTSCKQKYIYRKLVSVNADNGKTFSDTFRIPSCCSCTVKLSVETRMGGPQTPAKR